MIHPARTMPYQYLIDGLYACIENRSVKRRYDKDSGLTFFMYTTNCVHDKLWNEFSLIARGLIIDETNKKIVATPFPKFFNFGENAGKVPDGPFEVFDKLDGSLIILFNHNGEWRTSTKLDIHSNQSQWAQDWIQKFDLSKLDVNSTYLFEATYPENRIVVQYKEGSLSLLGAYDGEGTELEYEQLLEISKAIGSPIAGRKSFNSFAELLDHTETLSANEEGFVVRWKNGIRLKVKGAEYRRIHALISGVTPLGLFNLIRAGDDLDAIRRLIPEEFWEDFDCIRNILEGRINDVKEKTAALVESVASLSNKEIGLSLKDYPVDIRGYLFSYRKHGWERTRESVLQNIRPTANELEGYTPSYEMRRAIEESMG